MIRKTRFVISGFGNVGRQVAAYLARGGSEQLEIAAIAARDRARARAKALELGLDVPVISAAEAPDHASVIVEAGTHESFRNIVEPGLKAGAHVIVVSAGALTTSLDLIDLAERKRATLQIANGTLPGLDILRSAREAGIDDVYLESCVLPESLADEGYVHDRGIDLSRAGQEAIPIFRGTARDAARCFPRHFNVAVAVSLAGIGLDRTKVDISTDGRLSGVRHTVHVNSPVVKLRMTAENLPSYENNRTSRIVAPSILAALRCLTNPVRVGS